VTAILVVERDSDICNFLSEALETELAACVTCVNTGALGAKAIDTGCFDLAIIDVRMSQMSGYELAKRAANRNIPTILSSGHPDALAKLKEFDLPHLPKPYLLNDLIFAAAQVIVFSRENISRLQISLDKMLATADSLRADLAETRRLLKENSEILSRK
jgi:DNA-binding NtrC family response regulator